jgi:hypothetical protein
MDAEIGQHLGFGYVHLLGFLELSAAEKDAYRDEHQASDE